MHPDAGCESMVVQYIAHNEASLPRKVLQNWISNVKQRHKVSKEKTSRQGTRQEDNELNIQDLFTKMKSRYTFEESWKVSKISTRA